MVTFLPKLFTKNGFYGNINTQAALLACKFRKVEWLMKVKTSLFRKTEERDTTGYSNHFNFINSFFKKNPDSKKSKRILAAGIGMAVLITGFAVLFSQSWGYTVFYEDKALGFVDSPEEVLDNIAEINGAVSEIKNMETTMYKKDFSFEKGFRLFYGKSGWQEIAAAAEEKCEPDVNIYEVYVDGNLAVQDSSMDRAVNAAERIKEEYISSHPEDDFTEIDFVEKFEIRALKGSSAETADENEIYAVLNDMLTVKTITEITAEKTVPYEIIYEPTETRNCGETAVKTAGVDGKVETVTYIEKHDGQQVSSKEVQTKVINETVDQVVLVGTKGLVVSDAGMVTPSRGTVSSNMGSRWGRVHKGIDVPGDTGDPIYAAKEGTVTVAEYKNNGYGNVIEIDHGNGLVTLYAHLDTISVKPGDFVYPGQVIGGMGTTGRSTGVHLHFEVLLNGANVNPLSYVKY